MHAAETAGATALETALREAFGAAGHQSRHSFLRLRPSSGGGFRIETTESQWLDSIWSRATALAGETPLQRVVLPDSTLRGRAAVTAASVAEVRREPRHEAEQVTQVLQGEVVEPLLHEEGWLLGRLPDGYVGWIRDWHLRLVPEKDAADFAARVSARIGATWTVVRAEPTASADPSGETMLGSAVVVHSEAGDWTEIELAGGRRGWLPSAALRSGVEVWPADVASILATMRRFLGVPYLWGGRSPKGFDCSGLVQYVFGLHGVNLPRDSDEQARCGDAVESPCAGDLLFFGKERVTHVAVALDTDRFLHARGEVRIDALHPGTPLHNPELRSLWCGTRRVLPPSA